ncbi:MAG: ABC transporter ATP-binding protein [Bosea sp.]|uniref:ABC transporter ATP-binding protein n=1 Tax=Bosea sp. (in: a-proteobacteria) TaxID=1871050 RepID=UPI001ACCEC4A|nr:ABC transporter ATP-binding protein [Bosea sp. (in: a-proteobacteria)]MBN9451494.1 ABC transporter ATP-binding protein [Bosea sp. (in: a-proteobacteria)]
MSGAVSFVGVRKFYGTVEAVKNVDLAIKAGEFVSLLGPSGSGKSTLLMMLAGLEHPSAGDLLVDGRSIVKVPANKRNLGMVFQKYTLFPHMTVAQNIAFPLTVRGVSVQEQRRKIADALRVVRLQDFGDRLPGQLSGGQQQRIALARALVYDPPVLLMDEPFAALDRKLRLEMQDEIRRIQQELNLTIVFVTHDQEEALRISHRVAVLAEGKMQQIGTPKEIYEEPANGFVAQFIGNVNFLSARLDGWDDKVLVALLPDGRRIRVNPQALRPSAAPPGTPLRIAIRPENLAICENSDNALGSGTVLECVYLGEKTTCVLRTATGADVTVVIGAHDPKPQPGSHVAFDLRVDTVPVFAEAA